MKILVLTSRFPYPLEKGDKLRIYYQVRELYRAGHTISLVSLTEEKIKDADYQELKAFCNHIYVFPISRLSICYHVLTNILRGGKRPFQVAYFYNFRIQKRINEAIETEKPDLIYCHLARMSPYIENRNLPKSLDFMDAFGAGTRRRAEISSPFLRPFWRFEARLMYQYEQLLTTKFDFSTIISEQDKCRLPLTPESKEVYVVPNGVDIDFFDIINFKQKKRNIVKKYDICFIGNLGYYSNIEAIRFLVKKILPLVLEQKRDIKILLAGARPTAEVEGLSNDHITVVGWLDDIRDAYAQSRILVAPLMHGIGQQNKILEAMAINVPVVTTSRVNKAIGAVAEKQILLADTEEMFAAQILRLLQDVDLQDFISKNGRDFVLKNYSWTSSTQILINLLKHLYGKNQPN